MIKPFPSFFFLTVQQVRHYWLLSKMPWPTILFCPWSIFCCCCLILPVPKGTNAWKCLHFSLVSWKSWPIDKKNTSATIIWHLQSFWSYWLFKCTFLNPSHMFMFYSVTFLLLLNKSWEWQCLLILFHCCHEVITYIISTKKEDWVLNLPRNLGIFGYPSFNKSSRRLYCWYFKNAIGHLCPSLWMLIFSCNLSLVFIVVYLNSY